jgi:hypothetical protein
MKTNRHVTFYNKAFIYLIPSYKDIEIWWDNIDYIFALESKKKEIRELMLRHK